MNDAIRITSSTVDQFRATSVLYPDNAMITTVSSINDDIWDISELIHIPSAKDWQKKIDFIGQLPEAENDIQMYNNFVLPLKEYCYARIHNPLINTNPIKATTLPNIISYLKPFIYWCISERYLDFTYVDNNGIEDYMSFILSQRKEDGSPAYSTERITSLFSAVRQLYVFRDKYSKSLSVTIPKNITLSKLGGEREAGHENRTPVIPENIYFDYMRIAYEYVEIYSHDILEANDDIASFAGSVVSKPSCKSYSRASTIVAEFCTSHLPNLSLTNSPSTNLPWRDPWDSYSDFLHDYRHLEISCWVIIIGLSGIRLSEFLSLEHGCITRNKDGRIYMTGKTYKGKIKHTKEKWVVNEIVASAIHILERMTEHKRKASGLPNLCLISGNINPLYIGLTGSKTLDEYISSIRIRSSSSVLERLNIFSEYIVNKFSCSAEMLDFKFNTRHFRRTLAHYIAKQPFGIIAGKIQFKHTETCIFEGYAGSDSTFMELLNKERSLASIDFIEEVLEEAKRGELAGPKGVEIIESFKGVAGDNRKDALGYYLGNKRMNIYPGMFNLCFFDPEAALCLKNKKQKEHPLLNACRPDYCPNSCITNKHLPAWSNQIKDAEAMLKSPKATEIQKISLKSVLIELRNAIKPFIKDNKYKMGG